MEPSFGDWVGLRLLGTCLLWIHRLGASCCRSTTELSCSPAVRGFPLISSSTLLGDRSAATFVVRTTRKGETQSGRSREDRASIRGQPPSIRRVGVCSGLGAAATPSPFAFLSLSSIRGPLLPVPAPRCMYCPSPSR